MKNKDLKRITKEAVCKFLINDMTNVVFSYFVTLAHDEGIDPDAKTSEIEKTIKEFITDIKEHFDIY